LRRRLFGGLDRLDGDQAFLSIQLSGYDHGLPGPLFRLLLIIQMVDGLLFDEHERTPEMGNAVTGAVGGGGANRLVFQHFLVRPGERVNVESAGAVANLTAKSRGVARGGGEDGQNGRDNPALGDLAFQGTLLGEN